MHLQLSLYFIFCIVTSVFYPHGLLTTILLMMLLLIQQYFYYLLYIDPPIVEPWSYCTECKKMTTNSYIHCKQCNLCFPVTYSHWNALNRCVSKTHSTRYRNIVLIQLCINLFCSILQSMVYPPFIIVFITTVIFCKSMITKLQVNI